MYCVANKSNSRGMVFEIERYIMDISCDEDNYFRRVIIPSNIDMNSHCFQNSLTKGCFVYNSEILLSEKYYLYDIKTIKKFNLPITPFYISNLSELGCIEILEWLKNSNLLSEFNYDESAFNKSATYGIDCLEWWFNSGLPLKYDTYSLYYPSTTGNTAALEWWKNSGLELKYDEEAIDSASLNGHINVLDWWKNSGLHLMYSKRSLDWASGRGHINVLDWWFNSGLELKYDVGVLSNAYLFGFPNVTEWWVKSGLPLPPHGSIPPN